LTAQIFPAAPFMTTWTAGPSGVSARNCPLSDSLSLSLSVFLLFGARDAASQRGPRPVFGYHRCSVFRPHAPRSSLMLFLAFVAILSFCVCVCVRVCFICFLRWS
jgi:hypothetical protein